MNLEPKTINASYDESSGTTTINVSFIYESTSAITNASETTTRVLQVIDAVPAKPPNGRRNFCLKSCSANVADNSKSLYNAQAVYSDDACDPSAGADSGGSGGNGGGGGRGPCLPPKTQTSTTIRAMKDYPITNSCGTPILPTPQIEVAMLQRTVVEYHMGKDTADAENDLVDGMGKIDEEETEREDARRNKDLRGNVECPEVFGHPAAGENDDQRKKNRPCGSMLNGGSVGPIQSGPCGSYYAVTKNWVDGNFRSPGIAQVGYKKCYTGTGLGGTTMHTGTVDGQKFPIVAMENIGGGVIAWPGQPGVKGKK